MLRLTRRSARAGFAYNHDGYGQRDDGSAYLGWDAAARRAATAAH